MIKLHDLRENGVSHLPNNFDQSFDETDANTSTHSYTKESPKTRHQHSPNTPRESLQHLGILVTRVYSLTIVTSRVRFRQISTVKAFETMLTSIELYGMRL
ncbi:hypothetical protein EUTSA_v10002737mg [Eutrema salsugineum]|uniref:Uncharacterized protein n=1 Tax=Eutrema salsugineum TaxID=72664 RepID=V4L561_EUTSA|nr:hypothetical protein EUTSA_v10002737mg [Eutrema salsugineum]